MRDLSRRKFVYGTGATIAAGAFAGCTGDDDDPTGGDDGENGENGDEQDLAGWLEEEDANEFEGELEDHTGEGEVTIEVGGGDGLAFTPAGITVDAGTDIVWEWTGEGGQHNVATVEGSDYDFESDTVDEAGHTFEETLDEEGEVRYECSPHRGQGMVGGIQVE